MKRLLFLFLFFFVGCTALVAQRQGGDVQQVPACLIQAPISIQPALAHRPSPPPSAWRALLGEYGTEKQPIYVVERDGRLALSIEKSGYTFIKESGRDLYRATGACSGEEVAFQRDSHGRATSVTVAGFAFARRIVGPDEGVTFRIQPLRPVEELRAEALKAQPPQENRPRQAELVELAKLDPAIKLDIRYATNNNFLGTPFYSQARAFLQKPAAEALVRAHQRLKKKGYGLLIHDAYRPWSVTKMFWDATPDDKKIFVADPAKGSRHNRGCAVDLTLYDLKTGRAVQMVGEYDEMSPRSYPDYPGGTSEQRWLRALLRSAMETQGFQVYEFEWWHFDYKDHELYPILNVPFEQLGK